ncbi:MAG: zf-HC2 domain-containing protein [Candidatus Dormibacteraceae bacterium]
MTCRQIVELLTDYLEGVLPVAERTRLEAHLAGCRGCTAFLEQVRTTLRVVRGLAAEPLPPAMEAELLVAFRDWHRP